MVRQLSCDVGGARYAVVYSIYIECTYISYMRDGESYKSVQIGSITITITSCCCIFSALILFHLFFLFVYCFFFFFLYFVSYPSRCASSAVCVGADGILVFSVLPVLSRSLK